MELNLINQIPNRKLMAIRLIMSSNVVFLYVINFLVKFFIQVLLLEAGIEEPFFADVPALAPLLQRSNIDWGYMTQPEKHNCKSRPNGRCAWARGKVMGGSSTINYMIYQRGNMMDYNEWKDMGNEGI